MKIQYAMLKAFMNIAHFPEILQRKMSVNFRIGVAALTYFKAKVYGKVIIHYKR